MSKLAHVHILIFMVASKSPASDIGQESFLTEILRDVVLLPLMAALDKRLQGELA
jgi:hypothetical protein